MNPRDRIAAAIYGDGSHPDWLTTVDGSPNAAAYELADRVLQGHGVLSIPDTTTFDPEFMRKGGVVYQIITNEPVTHTPVSRNRDELIQHMQHCTNNTCCVTETGLASQL